MSNGKQERIVCAAVRLSYLFIGDYNTGTKIRNYHVVCGVTYDSIRDDSLFRERRFNYSDGFESVDGFITNKNRFVDPIEARKIAAHAGQASWFYERLLDEIPDQRLKPLKPEDLY